MHLHALKQPLSFCAPLDPGKNHFFHFSFFIFSFFQLFSSIIFLGKLCTSPTPSNCIFYQKWLQQNELIEYESGKLPIIKIIFHYQKLDNNNKNEDIQQQFNIPSWMGPSPICKPKEWYEYQTWWGHRDASAVDASLFIFDSITSHYTILSYYIHHFCVTDCLSPPLHCVCPVSFPKPSHNDKNPMKFSFWSRRKESQ